MIRRPPRSTRVRSSAASDVYKRQRRRLPLSQSPVAEQQRVRTRRSGRYHLGMAHATKLTKSEVERRRAAAERARGMLGRDPGRSFSDELIAERRAEARAEDREEEARKRRAGR